MHDERPHEVRPHRADAVEGVPARDDAVRLDRRGTVLRELEALLHDDVRLAEGAVRVAVDEPPVVREVRTDGLVQDGRVRLERALGVHHGGQRLVAHLHEVRRVLGNIAALADDDGDGLADEARLVSRRTVVADGRGDAHREGLGVLQNVLAREDADDSRERARGFLFVNLDPDDGERAVRASPTTLVEASSLLLVNTVMSGRGVHQDAVRTRARESSGLQRMTSTVRTTCPYCGVGCGVLARRLNGTVEIAGDPEHPAKRTSGVKGESG